MDPQVDPLFSSNMWVNVSYYNNQPNVSKRVANCFIDNKTLQAKRDPSNPYAEPSNYRALVKVHLGEEEEAELWYYYFPMKCSGCGAVESKLQEADYSDVHLCVMCIKTSLVQLINYTLD